MKKILLIILIFVASHLYAVNYYVSNSGNDSNTGLSDTQAWSSLSKINGFSFANGDSLFFKCGGLWNGTITLGSKTSSNLLVISSYGTGNKPEIRAWGDFPNWNIAGTWSVYSGNVYRTSITNLITRIWLNGKQKKRAASIAALSSDTPWFWDFSSYLYILTDGSNPASYYNSIIWPATYSSSLSISAQQNVTIQNINFSGGYNTVLLTNCDNIVIDSNEIGQRSGSMGVKIVAIGSDSCTYITIQNNKFETLDSLYNTVYFPQHITYDGVLISDGCSHVKVRNNYFNNWMHGGVELNSHPGFICHDNEIYSNYVTTPLIDYGRGFVVDYPLTAGGNNSVHDNVIYRTNNMNQVNGKNLKVYNNVIDSVRGCPYPEKTNDGGGISLESYAYDVTGQEIYNNTVTRCQYYGMLIWGTNDHEKAYANIHDNNFLNNNIVNNREFYEYTTLTTIHDNTYQNNHIYNSKNSNTINIGGAYKTVDQFNSWISTNGDIISGNNATIDYSIPNASLPTNIQDLYFYYNYNQATTKTIYLSQPMIDQSGNKYSSAIDLPSMSSIVLLVDPTPPTPTGAAIHQIKAGTNNLRVGSYNLAIP